MERRLLINLTQSLKNKSKIAKKFASIVYRNTNKDWLGIRGEQLTFAKSKEDKRRLIKIGRYLKKQGFSDTEISEYSSLIKEHTFEPELISGWEIADIYSNDPDENNGGLSCMSGQPKNRFKLYALNPNVFKMVVVRSPKRILGRALIYDTDQGPLVYDTIYYHETYIKHIIERYMTDNNVVLSYGGLSITVPNKNYRNLPYLDTFYKKETTRTSIIFT